MKNKYYTPGIEEFAYGLDYEHIALINAASLNLETGKCTVLQDPDRWVTDTFGESQGMFQLGFNTLPDMIKEGKVRVKHLDREDIESLGFRTDPVLMKGTPSQFTHVKQYDEIMLCYLQFFEEPEGMRVVIDCGDKRFSGIIRNKSELKKVLKMIGV